MGIFNFGDKFRRAAQEVGDPNAGKVQKEAFDKMNKGAENKAEAGGSSPEAGASMGEEYKGEAVKVDIDAVQAQMDAQQESIERVQEAARIRAEIQAVPDGSVGSGEAPWGKAGKIEAIQVNPDDFDSGVGSDSHAA